MRVLLTPCDILHFRDGRPFAAGSEHYAESLFPPHGATVYHALRTALLAKRGHFGAALRDKTTERIDEMAGGRLALRGLFLHDGKEAWFPAPSDLRRAGRKKEDPFVFHPLVQPRLGETSLGLELLPVIQSTESSGLGGAWMSASELAKYLEGRTDFDRSRILPLGAIAHRERRIGVGLDAARRTAAEGRLFQIEGVSLEPGWSIGAWLADGSPVLDGIDRLPLGGERRFVACRAESGDPLPTGLPDAVRKTIVASGRFRLLLLTSAFFANGWRPGAMDAGNVMEVAGTKIRLLSMMAGRPIRMGGYDITKNRQKTMVNLLPAGSVMHCEIEGGATDEKVAALARTLHLGNLTDEHKEYGLGLLAIGGMNR